MSVEIQTEQDSISVSTQTDRLTEQIFAEIKKSYASHKGCFICRDTRLKHTQISKIAIHQAFMETNILIPYSSKCCESHLDEFRYLNQDALR